MRIFTGKNLEYTADQAVKEGFVFRINGQNCKLMAYRGNAADVVIPAYINGKPVRQIRTGAFAGKGLQSVRLPDTLRVIWKDAFAHNPLTNITLPGNIRQVADGAFSDCPQLREVTIGTYIPTGIETRTVDISCHAFERTPYITAKQFIILDKMLLRINLRAEQFLEIPEGIREIKADACGAAWNYSVTEIGLPVSVNRIGARAFANLGSLKDVLLEKGKAGEYCLTLGEDAFGRFERFSFGWCRLNHFLWNLYRRTIIGDSRQESGRITFNNNGAGYKGILSQYGTIEVYVPLSCYTQFWKRMRVIFTNGKFALSLAWKEYQQLFRETKSLYDRIEMAVCMIQITSARAVPEQTCFLAEHINRAVKYALEKNQKERLMLYRAIQILQPEQGGHAQKARRLAERYGNEAARYLLEVLG